MEEKMKNFSDNPIVHKRLHRRKRSLVIFIGLLFSLFIITTPGYSASCSGTPGYVTPSGNATADTSTNPASNAKDGNTGTYWQSGSGNTNHWIRFDLGNVFCTSNVKI